MPMLTLVTVVKVLGGVRVAAPPEGPMGVAPRPWSKEQGQPAIAPKGFGWGPVLLPLVGEPRGA